MVGSSRLVSGACGAFIEHPAHERLTRRAASESAMRGQCRHTSRSLANDDVSRLELEDRPRIRAGCSARTAAQRALGWRERSRRLGLKE